jgi:hypothetical protein
MRSLSIGLILSSLVACTGDEDPTPETIYNTITVTETVTNVVTRPPEPSSCEQKLSGTICTYVGTAGMAMFSPEGLDRLESALYLPQDMTWGPDGKPYLLDFNNHRIRTLNADDTVVTIAGTGFLGDGIFNAELGMWEDGPAMEFAFNHPTNIAFNPLDDSAMYVAAWHNSRIERYVFASREMEFVAGTGARNYGGDGGMAATALLDLPSAIAFDDVGNLFFTDQANQLIRKIAPDGTITRIAGFLLQTDTDGDGDIDVTAAKQAGYAGDGGPALEAKFNATTGQAADPASRLVYHDGALFIADTENQLIRRIDLTTGIVDRVVGTYTLNPTGVDTNGDGTAELFTGIGGYSGDGGDALAAQLNRPRDLAIAPDGTIYIADTDNHCIRVVTPDGMIDTFAGVCGTPGLSGDGGAPTDALLHYPFGVALDEAGNVYIADTYNHTFRVVYR